ncbi:class I SAM-dependent methyltransferase [Verrucomicrobiota bacterium]
MPSKLRYLPYPPTSLPVRDLFVLEQVFFTKKTRLMEIGVGCGETSARLAAECGQVVGVDIAEKVIGSLEYLKKRFRNLELVCVDVTNEGKVEQEFDVIVSCDTLEHVNKPDRFFCFVAEHLKSDGVAHVLFPNEFPSEMHGVTRFESEDDLRRVISGMFSSVQIYRADLRRWPRLVVTLAFGWKRILCRRENRKRGEAPQCFDNTRFFRNIKLWKRISPLINFYWFVVLGLCRLFGRVYLVKPVRPLDFETSCDLYVRLTK